MGGGEFLISMSMARTTIIEIAEITNNLINKTYLGEVFWYTAIEIHRGHDLPPTMTPATAIQIVGTSRRVHIISVIRRVK
jgi:hypothetical protein